jgi:hypothetical protein
VNRRLFLKGLAATAAGLLIPADVLAEPERRVFPLDKTMLAPRHQFVPMTVTMSEWFAVNISTFDRKLIDIVAVVDHWSGDRFVRSEVPMRQQPDGTWIAPLPPGSQHGRVAVRYTVPNPGMDYSFATYSIPEKP